MNSDFQPQVGVLSHFIPNNFCIELLDCRKFFCGKLLRRRPGGSKFRSMARYSETIQTNEDAIRRFAENLRVMAADFDKQADFMRELGISEVPVTHWKSARDSVTGFAAFAAAIKRSIVETSMLNTVDAMVSGMQKSLPPTVTAALDQAEAVAKKMRKKKGDGA